MYFVKLMQEKNNKNVINISKPQLVTGGYCCISFSKEFKRYSDHIHSVSKFLRCLTYNIR